MVGSTNVIRYETISENVTVKSFWRGAILLILAIFAWAAHESILLVCLSHIQKIMQAINKLLEMSVNIAHPLPVHLPCFQKNKTNFTTKILICIVQLDIFC